MVLEPVKVLKGQCSAVGPSILLANDGVDYQLTVKTTGDR